MRRSSAVGKRKDDVADRGQTGLRVGDHHGADVADETVATTSTLLTFIHADTLRVSARGGPEPLQYKRVARRRAAWRDNKPSQCRRPRRRGRRLGRRSGCRSRSARARSRRSRPSHPRSPLPPTRPSNQLTWATSTSQRMRSRACGADTQTTRAPRIVLTRVRDHPPSLTAGPSMRSSPL